MARTVIGLFDTSDQARSAVEGLMALGVVRDDISLIARDVHDEYGQSIEEGAAEGATSGAIGGGVLGGLLGLLLGAGVLAIPGIGPLVLAGPLATALGSAAASTLVGAGVGAVSGGMLGALVGAGVPEDEAGYYLEGVRRGGILVSATVEDSLADRAYATLLSHGAVNMNERIASWQNEDGHDERDAAERPTGPLPTAQSSTSGPADAVPTPTTPHHSAANETVEYESPAQREHEYGAATGDSQREVAPDPNASAGQSWKQSDKVGTATGTVAGAAGGAAIGAAGGVIGAVVGGVAGAAAGAGAGAAGDIADEEHDSREARADTAAEERHGDERLRREEDRY